MLLECQSCVIDFDLLNLELIINEHLKIKVNVYCRHNQTFFFVYRVSNLCTCLNDLLVLTFLLHQEKLV